MIKFTRKTINFLTAFVIFAAVLFPASAKKAKAADVASENGAVQAEEESKPKKSKNQKVKIVDSVPDEGVFQAKTVENTVGSVKYLMKGTVGSFQLYALGENGSQIPLFAGYDEFTSSFMSLLVGKKEYRLTDNIGIVIGARKSENGAQLVYIVPDVARVHLKFEQVPHGKEVTSEIIKVTSTVYNKSKIPQNYALKSVLDTVLGEQFGPHFYSSEEIAINNERQYRKFDKVKWVASKNSRAGVQFLFKVGDVVTPEVVSLSNKDFLALRDWVPGITVSRSFDSVLSYQNSALCINWPSARINPEESVSYSYYIAVATDGRAPDGEKFIEEVEKKLKKNGDEKEKKYSVKEFEEGIQKASAYYAASKYQEAHAVVLEMWENPKNRNQRLASLRMMIEEKLGFEIENDVRDVREFDEDVSEKKSENPKITISPETITKEQLDAGYIQALVDKINNMKAEDDVERKELYKLNAELDAILEKLR